MKTQQQTIDNFIFKTTHYIFDINIEICGSIEKAIIKSIKNQEDISRVIKEFYPEYIKMYERLLVLS